MSGLSYTTQYAGLSQATVGLQPWVWQQLAKNSEFFFSDGTDTNGAFCSKKEGVGQQDKHMFRNKHVDFGKKRVETQ